MRRVTVLLPNALSHGFDYGVPADMQVQIGDIVQVSLAKKPMIGVVWSEGSADVIDPKKLKSIEAICDTIPPFSDAMRRYIAWVADYTLAPLGAVLKMALACPKALTNPPRKLYQNTTLTYKLATLNPAQQAVSDEIIAIPERVHKTLVIDGITGSGKTEIYCTAIAERLRRDESAQVLVLLPEIALTHQLVARFEAVFGAPPVLWHSHVSEAERKRSFLAIAQGKARIILGARSALFLPYANLSLIVVDEEHEASYKQEDGVLYHARDMAVARASQQKIPILLVSATPSLETLANVESGKYVSLSLPTRHGGAELPSVSLIDMRTETTERGGFLSQTLRAAMLGALLRGEQALLFLNRRGYAPLMLCRACGHRFQCSHCSAWLVLHKARKKLVCHHCGHVEPELKDCPACHAEDSLVACGPGVERVAEEVAALIPDARISVLSSDASVEAEELVAITAGQRDIIIGTQMVAKGHHFPNLTMVGVVDADMGLQGGDLRASERSFQLLHQVSGRAGRAALAGHVYLQTYQPEHPVMQALAASDRDSFMALEREGRAHGLWPPYGQLASLLFDGARESEVRAAAQNAVRVAPRDARITVLGPAPAGMSRVRGQYRYRVLIKTTRAVHLQKLLHTWCAQLHHPRSVRLKVDVNPYNFM